MNKDLCQLASEIRRCRICEKDFRATATAHSPRPVFWCKASAKILVAGQAPGIKVHQSGIPFDDRSGVRLRNWMGVSAAEFYDKSCFAILPMAFCFPGYDDKGADLPPPKVCAGTWHERIADHLENLELSILVGGYAQRWYLGQDAFPGVTETVAAWKSFAPCKFPVPHPSWRNNGWLRRNPWFERELVPELRLRVRELLERGQ